MSIVKSRLFPEYELLPADDELEGVDDKFFQSDRSDARELAASTQFSVDDINETICLYKDNEQEEVDPNALEREVESDVEEESRHDEDEVDDDDEDDAELNIYGTWRTESDGFHVRWPRVRVPVHDRDCLPVHAGRPGDRDRLPADHASSATFPFFLTTRIFMSETTVSALIPSASFTLSTVISKTAMDNC
ncbi:hypothetical protein Taro_025159 [Colocasia esculenta]|uniref:Uncharacterized protein n=1 Tax=Colocasia esculenta TaxID=4460 RepID=A0A843VDE7_COLES|nr:hypothetical protein [Colocasia esculenta]